MISGTIKAMLSGPGTFAENESNEVHFKEIPLVEFSRFSQGYPMCIRV